MDLIFAIGHWGGALGVLFANVAVWYGVYLEGEDKPKEVQAKGWSLLLKGLAAEAAFGFLLFASDAAISDAQQKKIIMLEESVASRPFDSALFLKRLVNVPKKPLKILYVSGDPDSSTLAVFKITMALIGAGWDPSGDGPGIPKEIELCGGPFGGVSVMVGQITQAEFEDFKKPPSKRTTTPWAMADAIDQGLGGGKGVSVVTCPYVRDGIIRIIVSKRPPTVFPKP